jgi:DedD protein
MDKALKQRLVGASVLILLAVIVLPMLLSGQQGSQQETRNIEVPPKPSELSFETRRFPVGGQDGTSPSVVEKPVPNESGAMDMDAGDSVSQAVVPPSQATPESDTDDPEGSESAEAIDVAPGRYLVQVASFSTTANANRLAKRLEEDGMPVLMDTVETAAGRLHRVRVGPFDLEAGAQSAVGELRTRIPDLNPRVLDLRPDETAPVTEPSDPLVRWVVQAGSFAAAENAESLVTRLRAGGYTAYSAVVTGANGTAYKVRVGPVIERQSAVELANRLRADLQIDGLVLSVD